MEMDRNDLREELLAVLAAHRELDGSADEQLVSGLLERIANQSPERARHVDVRAAYDALIPVKPSTVVAIAVAQGAVMLVLGEFLLHRFFEFYYASGGLVQSLTWLGFIWIAEVVATLAVISALVPRVEGNRQTRRRIPASRRPSSFH
jgi:hypothetical protein